MTFKEQLFLFQENASDLDTDIFISMPMVPASYTDATVDDTYFVVTTSPLLCDDVIPSTIIMFDKIILTQEAETTVNDPYLVPGSVPKE